MADTGNMRNKQHLFNRLLLHNAVHMFSLFVLITKELHLPGPGLYALGIEKWVELVQRLDY